jgi:hypothetical protein
LGDNLAKKEIKSSIRGGLKSKMYYLAYPKPTSLYEMSQKIYNLQEGHSKIGPLLRHSDYIHDNYHFKIISKEDGLKLYGEKWRNKKILSRADPIIDEIKWMLKEYKDYQITDIEKKDLLKKLNSDSFRDFIGDTWHYVKPVIDKDFNASAYIIDLISLQSSLCFFFTTLDKNQEKMAMEESLDIIFNLPLLDLISKKSHISVSSQNAFKEYIKIFYDLPPRLLEKLGDISISGKQVINILPTLVNIVQVLGDKEKIKELLKL